MPYGSDRYNKDDLGKEKREGKQVRNGNIVGVDKRHEVEESSQMQVGQVGPSQLFYMILGEIGWRLKTSGHMPSRGQSNIVNVLI